MIFKKLSAVLILLFSLNTVAKNSSNSVDSTDKARQVFKETSFFLKSIHPKPDDKVLIKELQTIKTLIDRGVQNLKKYNNSNAILTAKAVLLKYNYLLNLIKIDELKKSKQLLKSDILKLEQQKKDLDAQLDTLKDKVK